MDFIKEIPIHTEEDAIIILKAEVTFGSISGDISNSPKTKTFGLTKSNAKDKFNRVFTSSNSNHFADGLMSDNIEDVQKAFKKLFVGCKVTIKTIEDS